MGKDNRPKLNISMGQIVPISADAANETACADDLPINPSDATASYQRYCRFLSTQLSTPASFVLSKTEIAAACDADLAVLPTRHSQNFRCIAQISQHVAEMGERLVVGDAYSHPLFLDLKGAANSGISSYIGAPIRGPGGDTVGVVCVVDSKIRDWSFVELTLLSEIAREIAAQWPQNPASTWRAPRDSTMQAAHEGATCSGQPMRF